MDEDGGNGEEDCWEKEGLEEDSLREEDGDSCSLEADEAMQQGAIQQCMQHRMQQQHAGAVQQGRFQYAPQTAQQPVQQQQLLLLLLQPEQLLRVSTAADHDQALDPPPLQRQQPPTVAAQQDLASAQQQQEQQRRRQQQAAMTTPPHHVTGTSAAAAGGHVMLVHQATPASGRPAGLWAYVMQPSAGAFPFAATVDAPAMPQGPQALAQFWQQAGMAPGMPALAPVQPPRPAVPVGALTAEQQASMAQLQQQADALNKTLPELQRQLQQHQGSVAEMLALALVQAMQQLAEIRKALQRVQGCVQ